MSIDPNRVKALFVAALDLPPGERTSFVARECGADAALRGRLDALLVAHDGAATVDAAPGTAAYDPDATRTADAQPLGATGEVIGGRYHLIDEVGSGGMGSVWRAEQRTPVKRYVAVKLIKAGMDSKAVLARFDAERQALAVMDHPNIAKVLDGGVTADGRPYFVMELVKGTPITAFADARKLTPRQRLELFVPLCSAIQHAHMKGVIHRDIKPSNVLVALYDDKAVPKVIDFGVAKATGAALTDHTLHTGLGAVVGTPEYMSPEQASLNNLDIDTRSDVYALGVLLYELLTGSPPFTRRELEVKGLLELLRVVREEEPPRPSAKLSTAETLPSLAAVRGTEPKALTGLLRNELDWIVMKALEKDRTRRYETANGFAADVLRYLSGEPVHAHPPSAGYQLKKFARKHRGPLLAGALVLLALLAGFAGTLFGLVEAKRQEGVARDETAKKEQARTDEAEQRVKAEAAGDRAAASDAYSRQTIDGIVDDTIRGRFGRFNRSYNQRPETPTEDQSRRLHTFHAFYERELTEHPTGDRHEAAALRLGMVQATLLQRDEACRTLDRLIDTLTARLTAAPHTTSARRALAEALEVRARAPAMAVRPQPDGSARPDDVRAAEADEPAYFARAEAEWRWLVADDPERAEYRFITYDYLSFEWRRLCSLAAQAEQVRLKRLPPPKDGFPPDLPQWVAAHRDRLFADLREAVAHFPDRPADADILRERVGEAAVRRFAGVEDATAAVREELLTALFRADLSRERGPTPPPADTADQSADGVWKDNRLDQYTRIFVTYGEGSWDKKDVPSDNYRVALAAWGTACREHPRYPWGEAFAAVLRREEQLAEVRWLAQLWDTPNDARRLANARRMDELIADLWKGIDQVRSRQAESPFRDGRRMHAHLRAKLLEFVIVHQKHLAGGLDEFAAWKAEQVNPTPAELRDRLLWQVRCFQNTFNPEFSTKVSKVRLVELAEDTYRDFETLFRHPAECDHVSAVGGYVVVARYLTSHHAAATRYDDAVRVARAAVTRAERLPTPKSSVFIHSFTTYPAALIDTIANAHLKAKHYPEAQAAFDEYLTFSVKRGLDVKNKGWAEDELRARTWQAVAVLHQGKADDAVPRSLTAIRRFWDGVEEADKRSPPDPYGRHAVQTPVLRYAATFAGEMRVAKADAAFDRWAADVLPLLEKVLAKVTTQVVHPPDVYAMDFLLDTFRVRMWEVFEAGRTKDAFAYADRILALNPEADYAGRIRMSRARMVAVGGDHAAGSGAAKTLLDTPSKRPQTVWFFGDAALCYAASATTCKGDDALREKYAVEAVRLLRVCWEKEPKELPKMARFPEFRPHAGRDDYQALLKEIDAKFPPPDTPKPESKK